MWPVSLQCTGNYLIILNSLHFLQCETAFRGTPFLRLFIRKLKIKNKKDMKFRKSVVNIILFFLKKV